MLSAAVEQRRYKRSASERAAGTRKRWRGLNFPVTSEFATLLKYPEDPVH
jgi:hypothetical protein